MSWMIINLKKKKMDQLENYLLFAPGSDGSNGTVLKCLYLARVGRPDILWSVNKLARAIEKWTKIL